MVSRTVLITGATSGIGLALYEKYVAQGDHVIACGRDESKLDKLCSKAMKRLVFDMTKPAQIESVSVDIKDIDILLLNAGDCRYIDDAKHFDGKLFSDIITTNLSSLGALLQCFLPLVNKGGQVVFVSSSATIVPFPRSEAYGASKAGMDYLAKSLRLDLVSENIGVTLVHPGFIKTPLTEKNDFEMPFLLTSDEAANRIFQGVNRRSKYLHFPKRLTFILKLFSILPASLWQSIILRK
ncbi:MULTISPECIES: SDR family NAD(P)-dependent oxidoreductase [unclassified Colwellia]|uniref:SDR family NAD(P)-dependent oxidoreductase n=1 Tax=unclassified Colwellia TaxID=196834 RepID=UPI0015F71B94|nr:MULTISPECIES: SDR family NAD(P)-dependent oxidoreductase [unclassified Colwellia]MBA6254497.1 SDR family NAD(P)-dependent oxidoreductase [Colwellia sp. MB3u-28]MBA6259194.1 SDR family NAD(P)-dependent oxidoreductase [Colwellia sp. MB3u-41]MBA6304689.1 SDR family NAD(P)-dependent oxidoreductase [Colwellia sp. MB02u-14]